MNGGAGEGKACGQVDRCQVRPPSVCRGEAGRCGVLVSGFLIQSQSVTSTGRPQSGRRCRQTLRGMFRSQRPCLQNGRESGPAHLAAMQPAELRHRKAEPKPAQLSLPPRAWQDPHNSPEGSCVPHKPRSPEGAVMGSRPQVGRAEWGGCPHQLSFPGMQALLSLVPPTSSRSDPDSLLILNWLT